MFILEEFRERGVGKKLMEGFIDWCKKKGVKRIKLVASIQNSKAIKFYHKLGFDNYTLNLEKTL